VGCFVAIAHGRFWQMMLQKSLISAASGAGVFQNGLSIFRPFGERCTPRWHCRLHWLREARISRWRGANNQLCKPSQVLRDGGKRKLILGATWTTQSKTAKLQDSFEVGE
jgi:hypothetical protein